MKKTASKGDIAPADKSIGRKQSIIRTAARLFAEQGYKATTMDTLADACKINKATLYYYYPSKADLLLDISLSVQSDLQPLSQNAAKDPDALAGLTNLTLGILNIANRDRDSFNVYFQESERFKQYLSETQYFLFRESERAMMKTIYGVINRGMYNGDFVECDVRYVGRLLVFMIISVARWPEPQIDVTRVMTALRTVFLSGLVNSKAP
jgi:AcrR family transcriptional regulator